MRQVILSVLAIVFFLPLSGQKIRTIGDNSPVVVADVYKAEYGIHPHIVLELIKVYDSEGLSAEERNGAVEELIKNYINLNLQGKQLSESDKSKLGTKDKNLLNSILEWDLFLELSTIGKNSPVVYAPDGYVEIWYGITPDLFQRLFETIEGMQLTYEEQMDKIRDLALKMRALKEELTSREDYDAVAKEIKNELDAGDLEEAERLIDLYLNNLGERYGYLCYSKAIIREGNLDYREAERYYRKAYFANEYNSEYALKYGKILYINGEYFNSHIYYQKSYDLLCKNFEEDSLKFSLIYNNLGSTLKESGKYDQALFYYKKAYYIDSTFLGWDHPIIAIRLSNIGLIYKEQGKLNKARGLLMKALKIDLNVYGDSTLPIGIRYHNLGIYYSKLGKYDSAISFLNKSFAIYKSELGKNNPSISSVFHSIGNVYAAKGKYEKAKNVYFKSFHIDSTFFSMDHPRITNTYNSLGIIFFKLEKYEIAENYFQKAIKNDLKRFEKFHIKVAPKYVNLGNLYAKQREYPKALNLYGKALKSYYNSFKDSVHPKIANVYNSIGYIYDSEEMFDSSISYYYRSLEILKTKYGEKHPQIATCFVNLGCSYGLKGNHQKAIAFFSKGIDIDTFFYGIKHPNIGVDFNNLGEAYKSNGECNKALRYLQRGLDILTKYLDPSHDYILNMNLSKAICLLNIGRIEEAKTILNQLKNKAEEANNIALLEKIESELRK